MLTPFAMDYLEESKQSAQKYIVNFIAGSIFCVFLPDHSHLSHVVDFAKKTCSDCHYYEEHLLPCVHLVAVWINHLGSESRLMMEEQTDERSMYKYLCGTPYWMETLEASLAGVSIALPISLDSVPIPSPNKLIIQQKTTKTLGRPALKRRASNMDCFQSGSVKKTKQTILFKENVANCLSPI